VPKTKQCPKTKQWFVVPSDFFVLLQQPRLPQGGLPLVFLLLRHRPTTLHFLQPAPFPQETSPPALLLLHGTQFGRLPGKTQKTKNNVPSVTCTGESRVKHGTLKYASPLGRPPLPFRQQVLACLLFLSHLPTFPGFVGHLLPTPLLQHAPHCLFFLLHLVALPGFEGE